MCSVLVLSCLSFFFSWCIFYFKIFFFSFFLSLKIFLCLEVVCHELATATTARDSLISVLMSSAHDKTSVGQELREGFRCRLQRTFGQPRWLRLFHSFWGHRHSPQHCPLLYSTQRTTIYFYLLFYFLGGQWHKGRSSCQSCILPPSPHCSPSRFIFLPRHPVNWLRHAHSVNFPPVCFSERLFLFFSKIPTSGWKGKLKKILCSSFG